MANSQPVLFRIPPSGLDDLSALAEHADKLDNIVKLVVDSDIQQPSSELLTKICTNTGLPKSTVGNILDGLAILRSLMDRLNIDVDDVVASVDSSIQVQATEGWRKIHQKKWKDASTKVAEALKSLPTESWLTIRQKAKELTYAHEHVLTDTSLVTDLRPVYNTDGSKIYAMVLTHVLTISYQGTSGQQRIEFALDAADVAKLLKTVERAKIKTDTAQKAFADKDLAVIVPGLD